MTPNFETFHVYLYDMVRAQQFRDIEWFIILIILFCIVQAFSYVHLGLGVAQVRLQLPNLTELLLCILRRDGRGHYHILSDGPVNGGSDALLVGGLQRINDTQYFGRVSAGRGRVQHGQADLLGGVNDEDGTDGEGDTLLGNVVEIALVDHIVEEGDFAVGIGNDGELDIGVANLVDVFDPFTVGAQVVGTLLVKLSH
jgi:hypothetical protein